MPAGHGSSAAGRPMTSGFPTPGGSPGRQPGRHGDRPEPVEQLGLDRRSGIRRAERPRPVRPGIHERAFGLRHGTGRRPRRCRQPQLCRDRNLHLHHGDAAHTFKGGITYNDVADSPQRIGASDNGIFEFQHNLPFDPANGFTYPSVSRSCWVTSSSTQRTSGRTGSSRTSGGCTRTSRSTSVSGTTTRR